MTKKEITEHLNKIPNQEEQYSINDVIPCSEVNTDTSFSCYLVADGHIYYGKYENGGFRKWCVTHGKFSHTESVNNPEYYIRFRP